LLCEFYTLSGEQLVHVSVVHLGEFSHRNELRLPIHNLVVEINSGFYSTKYSG